MGNIDRLFWQKFPVNGRQFDGDFRERSDKVWHFSTLRKSIYAIHLSNLMRENSLADQTFSLPVSDNIALLLPTSVQCPSKFSRLFGNREGLLIWHKLENLLPSPSFGQIPPPPGVIGKETAMTLKFSCRMGPEWLTGISQILHVHYAGLIDFQSEV